MLRVQQSKAMTTKSVLLEWSKTNWLIYDGEPMVWETGFYETYARKTKYSDFVVLLNKSVADQQSPPNIELFPVTLWPDQCQLLVQNSTLGSSDPKQQQMQRETCLLSSSLDTTAEQHALIISLILCLWWEKYHLNFKVNLFALKGDAFSTRQKLTSCESLRKTIPNLLFGKFVVSSFGEFPRFDWKKTCRKVPQDTHLLILRVWIHFPFSVL